MSSKTDNPFGARAKLAFPSGEATIFRLSALEERGVGSVARLPYSIKVLLEAVLRQVDGGQIEESHVAALADWKGRQNAAVEVPFKPARVLMQDFTGVPAVVDLAALRSAMSRLGGEPQRINPLIPVDLVIDHSVQVDRFGSSEAATFNAGKEFERNRERYTFLRWGSEAFGNFRVVPPATGIVHQVNLEHLADVVRLAGDGENAVALPDSLVGTDSHTTMINALGVLGWGVGGIEAEAAMLGQPVSLLPPDVVGVRLDGELPDGATATDLVLTVTELLRNHGVVGKFVEFHGPGLHKLSLPDRATIANMCPEYGATVGFFPVDKETLAFLSGTGRSPELVETVEQYCREQGLFHTEDSPEPRFTEAVSLDMSTVVPCIAGPRRPQDRIPLTRTKEAFEASLKDLFKVAGRPIVEVGSNGTAQSLGHGSVVIAAITSCTNTSNPSVMMAAGLLARKARDRGLSVSPSVKTSLAPGSRVVTRYLQSSGLIRDLEALRFHLVGYGCTTCIGNSGPLPEEVSAAVRDNELVVASVLSGNRNFEGRISPDVRANYLGSPPLVVAYALAGTMDIDFAKEPLGHDPDGQPVFLADVWPSQAEIRQAVRGALEPALFEEEYSRVFSGNEEWNQIPVGGGDLYQWDSDSTYIKEPPFFQEMTAEPPAVIPIEGARVLALLGDSVTTDHISPAGAIPPDGPAGRYLVEHGVPQREFNSFGSRRGNHEVMMRGTFGNIRIRNRLVPGVEGGYTCHLPSGEQFSIYDAAVRYGDEQTPLLVIAGREYGTGSSRDWAAKGTALLGVRAVLAVSYERIHRSNLIGMGVMPLEFQKGENAESLGLDGTEIFDVPLGESYLQRGAIIPVLATDSNGSKTKFEVVSRLDSTTEIEYYTNGGILHTVLRGLNR